MLGLEEMEDLETAEPLLVLGGELQGELLELRLELESESSPWREKSSLLCGIPSDPESSRLGRAEPEVEVFLSTAS